MRFHRTTALILIGGLALVGCKKKDTGATDTSGAMSTEAPVTQTTQTTVETTPANVPFKVTGIDLGTGVGSDKKITGATTTFGPKDTIYVSVATDGSAPAAKVKARWTYGSNNKLVNENEVTINPTGPTYTEFHISQDKGLPAGNYKVEIFTDGSSAGTKDFEVKK
ncbi:MAG TPA: hypothetical protein VGH73_10140 [Thermoanaerobaculia bacterium]|jgi:hypothetical protein